MKKLFILLGCFLILTYSSSAQFTQLNEVDYQTVREFIKVVKSKKLGPLKQRIILPLNRPYPIPDIDNEEDLALLAFQIMDDSLQNMIISSNLNEDWMSAGYRGIMFNRGLLWLNSKGQIIAINYVSNYESILRESLIRKDKEQLHESLRGYLEPKKEITTEKFRIRIDDMGENNLRYASWSIDSDIGDPPDLVIENGTAEPDGSGGNFRYEFTNGEFRYVCYMIRVGAEDSPPGYLNVFQNEKEILSQPFITLHE